MTKNKKFDSARSLNQNTKKSWCPSTIAAVFTIEFLLPSALSNYAVFFSDFVAADCFSFHDALWIPIAFIASWNIMNPWSRRICEHFEDTGSQVTKYISIISTMIYTLAVILSSFIQTQQSQVLLYGTLGGTITSFVLNQLRVTNYENFRSKPGIYDALCQVAKASSLFVIPHLILFAIDLYGVYRAQLLYAVFLLHAIPARLVTRNSKKVQAANNLMRYKTVPGSLWNQDSIELPIIGKKLENITKFKKCSALNNSNPNEVDSDDSSSESSDSYTIEEVTEDIEPDTTQQTILTRCKNEMGVEILPQIPEEDEIEEDLSNSKKLSIDMKRLSENSSRFDEIIDKNERSRNLFSETMNGDSSLTRRNTQKKCILFKEVRNSVCCSPYQKYLFRRRTRFFLNTIYDNFIKPLKTSVKLFYFFPALYGKTCVAVVSTIYITVIPYITLESGITHRVDVTEATFLLTFIAVSWCFFLISLPWLINTSATRAKILHILGLFIKSGSMFMLYISLTHDIITLSCLVFGFGFGITSYAEEIAYRESMGSRRWKQVRGTLDTLSGILVIVTYLIIYILKLEVASLFLLFFILILANTILWLLAPMIKFLWTYFRKRSRNTYLT